MNKIFLTIPLIFTLSCGQNITYSEIELNPLIKKNNTQQVIEIEKGSSLQLNGSVDFDGGKSTNDVLWSSSNTNIVKVSADGKVTAEDVGDVTLTITAKQDNSKKSIIKVKVLPYKEHKVEINSGTEGKLIPKLENTPEPVNQNAEKPIDEKIPKLNVPVSSISGHVFNAYGVPVDDALVNIVSIDKSLIWSSETEKTVNGIFIFKEVPINTLIQINVSKDGWSKSTRTEVLKPNNVSLNDNNVFNFGGDNQQDSPFAIQEEPQITDILINSKKVIQLDNKLGAELNNSLPPQNSNQANIKIAKSIFLSIKMSFNKEINTNSLEDNFKVISQAFSTDNDFYVIDKSNPNVSFSWNTSHTQVTISSRIKDQPDINNVIYRLQFNSPFIDTSAKSAIKGRYIKLNTDQVYLNDYMTFSMDKYL